MPVNNGCTMGTGEKKAGEKSPDETVFHTWFYTTYVNEAWMVLSASSPFIDRLEAIYMPAARTSAICMVFIGSPL